MTRDKAPDNSDDVRETGKGEGDRPIALSGIHHVTAIASDPGENLAFYSHVLGQRLVKRTVNFDDPSTYHLYYGDESGSPGSIMTFFPWPGARRGSIGAGQATVTAYAIPRGSINYWHDRLQTRDVRIVTPHERFGEGVLGVHDPDGLLLELVETEGVDDLAAWPGASESRVDEKYAIRGFRGVTLGEFEGATTQRFLTDVMGFHIEGSEGATTRYRIGHGEPVLGTTLDVETTAAPGRGGAGTVHHVAFRIRDDEAELAWRAYLGRRGQPVSPVRDRQYFHSIYFNEPGGVLFEIATDPPGFTADEPLETLGGELKLPPFLEGQRRQLEAVLPELSIDAKRRAS